MKGSVITTDLGPVWWLSDVIIPGAEQSLFKLNTSSSINSIRLVFRKANGADFNSAHANVHSENRPHYCPVSGCARSEGGKGFKRKNELIRHGLKHEGPGYICPFCPEREHKYPRPDNLQRYTFSQNVEKHNTYFFFNCRHVRVNHIDVDMNDPRLREVFAQRCEGGSRGRRRRILF